MAKKIERAMILAAGLGTRLKPITFETPKPLVDVGGRKVIEYNILLLKKSGIKDIVINLHHLGSKIKGHLGDGSKYGVKITYSKEEKILGTGGGIKKAEPLFKGKPFVVINGDVICDVKIKELVKAHLERGALATLAVKGLPAGSDYTPLKVEDGHLAGFGSGDAMYIGVQVIEPVVLKAIRPGEAADIVKDAYMPLLDSGGSIAAYPHYGFWTEIGTPEKLEEARELFEETKVGFWYL